MKERIQALLERELQKFETASLAASEPLDSRDIKSLETLIKCYHSFCNPTPPPPPASDPASSATEDLLNDVMHGQVQG
jgi:hypothetical protein